MARILVVDDSATVRELISTLLRRAGHDVALAADGAEGLRRMHSDRPDLLILDVSMPGLDGWDALRRVRELSDLPVLMVSASGGEGERVRGLLSGADEWLPKPFGGPELVARVTALLRRAAPTGEGGGVEDVVDDGWAHVDAARHQAQVAGVPLELTPAEFGLLTAFLRHPGAALSHDQLLDLAWREDFGTHEQVEVAVLGLRRKLGAAAPGGDEAVETVRGVGYRWITPDAAQPA